MGSHTITSLVLVLLSLRAAFVKTNQDATFIWRRNGGILKVEPVCGETTSDVSEINVYADFPVIVQVYCNDGTIATPVAEDGVTHSQLAGFSPDAGEDCLFEKTTNSEVYTMKVEVGWSEGDVAIQQAREHFLVDCSYDNKASNSTEQERIDNQRHIYDEIIHNMGPALENVDIVLEIVDVRGTSLTHVEVPLGRVMKLQAKVTGPTFVRPVNCIATNGVSMYRLLLGGCGDGLVFHKGTGFDVTGKVIASPYFIAFRLFGPKTLVFKCNFTACDDQASCDGSTCYKSSRSRRSLHNPFYLKNPDPYNASDEPTGHVISAGTGHIPLGRRRRSVCRLESLEHNEVPVCAERREDVA